MLSNIMICNTIYKVISKTIVGRLKRHVNHWIPPYQIGFVLGRSIHENIIIAKEAMHTMEKTKGRRGYFAVKLDLSKAYDKLNWNFIRHVLQEIKLPQNVVILNMKGVTSVNTNVNQSGVRCPYFRPQRGIRQGDPMLPYIFVLCMDKLTHITLQ